MDKKSSRNSGMDSSEKVLRQQFYSVGITKSNLYPKTASKERPSSSGMKKLKTHASVKTIGGNIIQNQIGKVRVSSGGRTKPGSTNHTEKQFNYVHDSSKIKRKSGGVVHSRNQIFQTQGGSQTGRSYHKSNPRETSPANMSKSPKQSLKKSRNSRLSGSHTQVVPKRRPSKKYSRDQEAYKIIKNNEGSKKNSNFLMYQQYPRMTKTNNISGHSRGQYSALSPKTHKNMMKTSSSAISGFEKYQLKANPSKSGDSKSSKERKMTNYLHSLASEGSRSKEDLKFVPVENISLFDDSHVPISARNPQNTGLLSSRNFANVGEAISSLKFFRYFKIIKLFKNWSGYCRRQNYQRKRQQLAQNLPWGKPFFIPFISGAIEPLNDIRYCSPLVEIKQKNVYTKKLKGHEGFILQCSNKQKQTISRLGNKFLKVLKSLGRLSKLKSSMKKASKRYEVERKVAVQLIDKAIAYITTSAIFSIRDLIRNEQNTLFKLLVPERGQTPIKFDFQLEFNHIGNVVPRPPFEEYTLHITNLYDSIRKSITLNNKIVEEFLYDIVTVAKDELSKTKGYANDPVDYVKRHSF